MQAVRKTFVHLLSWRSLDRLSGKHLPARHEVGNRGKKGSKSRKVTRKVEAAIADQVIQTGAGVRVDIAAQVEARARLALGLVHQIWHGRGLGGVQGGRVRVQRGDVEPAGINIAVDSAL